VLSFAGSPPLLASASAPVAARYLHPHVIEALLSDGVERSRKTGCGQETSEQAPGIDKDFVNGKIHLRQLSRSPLASLGWISSCQRRGQAVAIITFAM